LSRSILPVRFRLPASNALEDAVEKTDDARLKVQREIFAEMEAWLDRVTAVAYLREPHVATMLQEAIQHREGLDWRMFSYVIMPNHIHLFFELLRHDLKTVLEGFKRWTGHQAAEKLSLDGSRFWQDEWFDHWSRSDEEDAKITAYIRENPKKAGLVKEYHDWPHGSW
jgi:REP element-mobilizing transposase RayT